jgi:16S rRNA (cytidine1402-2'-O)-methyltransferase
MSGTLFVVATPIGNLEDITARALRILGEVSLIAAEDTRRTAHLLSRYAIATPTTSLHEHNESRKLAGLIERLQRGEHLALVSDAGTPTISDPGQYLVRTAIDAGIKVEVVPGPSAVTAAIAASGIAATGTSFTFLGFPPVRSKDRRIWFDGLLSAGRTVVFFEAPHRITRTLSEIRERLGDRRVAVARELTKVHEEFIRGTLSEVISRLTAPIGEFTVVLDVGQQTEQIGRKVVSSAELLRQFGLMTEYGPISKRLAVARLARQHGLSTNVVYAALEEAKKLAG